MRPLLRHWKALLVYTVVEIVGPVGAARARRDAAEQLDDRAAHRHGADRRRRAPHPLGQDRLDARRIIGLIVGFCGVGLLVGLDFQASDMTAVLSVLVVVIGYAIGPIVITRYLSDLPSIGVVTGSLVIAAVAYTPFAAITWPSHASAAALVAVAVLAVVCTAAAFLVMFALIAEAGPARMSMITYVNPIVAVVLGAIVLGEPITLGLLVGFPLILIGSVLGTWRSRPRSAPGRPRAGTGRGALRGPLTGRMPALGRRAVAGPTSRSRRDAKRLTPCDGDGDAR